MGKGGQAIRREGGLIDTLSDLILPCYLGAEDFSHMSGVDSTNPVARAARSLLGGRHHCIWASGASADCCPIA